ncbi:MAG: ROK family protein [Labilithrix sp.]|nr:ROK family protein [Labilithrix sp.]MCW5809568.1 ROK family protein [Labilithrix sp.]
MTTPTSPTSPRPGLRIGVDLGGTKVEAVVVEVGGAEPNVLARRRVPTERDRGYEHVLDVVRQLVLGLAEDAGIDAQSTPIGVGMPGSTTLLLPDGTRSSVPLIKNSNTTCLNGRPFRAELAEALGRDVAFANDANCFALAEATWGAARGARVAFGVIMGSGVGGGLVFDGHAWDGAQGIAGEWGHVPIAGPDAVPCYCGKTGCIETFLAGPFIEAAYERRAGTRKSLAEIATAKEDPIAETLLTERIELFGRALALVINVLDPDTIVLGGGVSNVDALYTRGRDAVAREIFNDELRTRIVKHALGDSAGVLGAALLA